MRAKCQIGTVKIIAVPELMYQLAAANGKLKRAISASGQEDG